MKIIKEVSPFEAIELAYKNKLDLFTGTFELAQETEYLKNGYVIIDDKKNLYTKYNVVLDNHYYGIFENNILQGLFLIWYQNEKNITLTLIQKCKKAENIMTDFLLFVLKSKYHHNILTAPIDKLIEEYYKSFGFINYNKDELILTYKNLKKYFIENGKNI